MNLQEIIDRGLAYDIVPLPPGEFEGPYYVRKPCTIVGNVTTIWSRKGPALVVESEGVTLANLRIEVIESSAGTSDYTAMIAKYSDIKCQSIEIIGDVKGLSGEEGSWKFPQILALGHFPANQEVVYHMELMVPVETSISTTISGVRLAPDILVPGTNQVTLTIEPCRHGTFFYGEIFLTSQLIHTIYMSALANEAVKQKEVEWVYKPGMECSRESALQQSLVLNSGQQLIREVSTFESPVLKNTSVHTETPSRIEPMAPEVGLLKRGERKALTTEMCQELALTLTYTERREKIDIDPYIILLDTQKKAHRDEDLIFFGHTSSLCGGVQYNEADKKMQLNLQKLSANVDRLAVVYSIYSDGNVDNFSKLTEVALQMKVNDKEQWRFPIEDLTIERTIVAAEIYRHNGQWKINAIGAGYRDGLERLCQEYGLEIAQ